MTLLPNMSRRHAPLPNRTVLAAAVLLLLGNGLAFAQSNVAAANGSNEVLQRVEVTASKRKQLRSDVAGTVTALDGALLERLGAADFEDVMKLTPGVQFNKGPADSSLLSIRGISTNTNAANQGFTQAPTGIYIEDVPFTDPFLFVSLPDLTPFDLERVEVLRGPQGALYGSSSMGGAIRYIVNKPNLKTVEGSVLGTFTSMSGGDSGWSTAAMANLPLSDGKAALRVVLNSRDDPGFIDNLGTGMKNSNSNRSEGGRLIFSYQPNADFDLTAMYMSQKSKQEDGSGISPFDYKTGTGYVKSFGKLQVSTAFPQVFDSKFDLGTVQFNANLGGLRLTSLTASQSKSRLSREDFSRDFFDPSFLGDRWTSDTSAETSTRSQEFRLAPVTPGAFNWLVGAFWMNGELQRDQKIYLEPRGAVPDLRFRRNLKATEKAIFADADFRLTERLTADVGVRLYQTTLQNERVTGTADKGTASPYASSENGNTPKVSLRYAFDPAVAVYALASRGYRFGGISNLGSNPVGRPYKSDSLWNYETGVRWAPSNKLTLEASLFRIDWKDLQLSELYLDPVINRSFLVTGNIGEARSQGLELASVWKPASALTLRGALAYTDASTTGGITLGGAPVASGTRLPGTAKVQTTLDATLNFDGPLGSSGRFSTVLAYTGERKAQIDSTLMLPAYTTLDLRLAFYWSKYEVSLFVNNATNERGISGAADYFSTYTEFYPIRPTSAGVSVRYDF